MIAIKIFSSENWNALILLIWHCLCRVFLWHCQSRVIWASDLRRHCKSSLYFSAAVFLSPSPGRTLTLSFDLRSRRLLKVSSSLRWEYLDMHWPSFLLTKYMYPVSWIWSHYCIWPILKFHPVPPPPLQTQLILSSIQNWCFTCHCLRIYHKLLKLHNISIA